LLPELTKKSRISSDESLKQKLPAVFRAVQPIIQHLPGCFQVDIRNSDIGRSRVKADMRGIFPALMRGLTEFNFLKFLPFHQDVPSSPDPLLYEKIIFVQLDPEMTHIQEIVHPEINEYSEGSVENPGMNPVAYYYDERRSGDFDKHIISPQIVHLDRGGHRFFFRNHTDIRLIQIPDKPEIEKRNDGVGSQGFFVSGIFVGECIDPQLLPDKVGVPGRELDFSLRDDRLKLVDQTPADVNFIIQEYQLIIEQTKYFVEKIHATGKGGQ